MIFRKTMFVVLLSSVITVCCIDFQKDWDGDSWSDYVTRSFEHHKNKNVVTTVDKQDQLRIDAVTKELKEDKSKKYSTCYGTVGGNLYYLLASRIFVPLGRIKQQKDEQDALKLTTAEWLKHRSCNIGMRWGALGLSATALMAGKKMHDSNAHHSSWLPYGAALLGFGGLSLISAGILYMHPHRTDLGTRPIRDARPKDLHGRVEAHRACELTIQENKNLFNYHTDLPMLPRWSCWRMFRYTSLYEPNYYINGKPFLREPSVAEEKSKDFVNWLAGK